MTTETRPLGRPRNTDADAAILGAALELLTERGAEAVSIEQVARRAGVTRATVYRRFANKTQLLIATIESSYGSPPATPKIRDLEHLLTGWASVLAEPHQRRLLRRLYGAFEDYPEIADTYQKQFGDQRSDARVKVLEQARDEGELPPDTDPQVLLDMLTGAGWQHLVTRPDTSTPDDVEQYLRAVLHQAGYRPQTSRDRGLRPTKE